MSRMQPEYLEKIYAGWLAKIIGVRLGAPVENWSYEKIKNVYGELDHYPVEYKKNFAADDDSNGPLFYLRALEDSKSGFDITPQDIGEALLNYAPYEHGFFCWGGYGAITEHTAYLNLRSGIPAPVSGSIEQNGSTIAEQIGGQIFIDTWGLVTPGNPDLAAKYAEKAASVTHDGNGKYGGIFIASCISYAFEETNIRAIIEKGLSYIPFDCEYARVVRSVMAFYDEHPQNWRDCFQYIFNNFGYDKYPGICHIIPNSAVMILSLLYGEGDFSRTINICNMCGWDTDCNVGNIATIMGVRCGLDAINYRKWRLPINDLLICSSVVGSLNIMDIPYGAAYIAKLAWAVAGEDLPQPLKSLIDKGRIDSCHFEYRGSTHAMRIRIDNSSEAPEYELRNTDETANTGNRSLRVMVKIPQGSGRVYLYKRTYYKPKDFHDSRYDPCFSPLLYPGQTIHGSICIPNGEDDCSIRMYAHNSITGEIIEGECAPLRKGQWNSLAMTLPCLDDCLIDEAGFTVDTHSIPSKHGIIFNCFIDDLYFDGNPNYCINFDKSEEEVWTLIRKEVSQFTRLKGMLYLESGKLNLSCSDFGEAYTGRYDWTDYTASFTMEPVTGTCHFVNVRVQGAIRSYAVGLTEGNTLGLYKNENGYRKLAEVPFVWEYGKAYTLAVTVEGNTLRVSADGKELLSFTDTENPYLTGSIGLSVRDGSHCRYIGIAVN